MAAGRRLACDHRALPRGGSPTEKSPDESPGLCIMHLRGRKLVYFIDMPPMPMPPIPMLPMPLMKLGPNL
jgi:hypothetical protein